MIVLNNEEIKSILDHTFEIELGQIALIQGNDEPIVLEGPGNIFQDEAGTLNLKMYHKFEDDGRTLFDKFFCPNRFKSGEIISESEFYRLEATDFFGNKWQAENISITPTFPIPASGAVFKAKLKEIYHQSEYPRSNISIVNFYLFGEYDIPVNELEDLGERGKHFNKLRFKANHFEFLFRKFEKGLHLTVTRKKASISPNLENHIIEALSIIYGKIVDPILIINVQSGIEKTKIRSVDSLQLNSPLPSAIVIPNRGTDFKGMRTFLGKYIKHFSIRSHKSKVLYGYWHKINRSYQTGIDNAALSITVSIEGIIKSFFKNSMYPDSNLRNKANISRRLIFKSEIDEDIKQRLLTMLGSIGNVSPKIALKRLSSSGYFRNNLADDWSVLRNKSTHSDKLGKSPTDVQRGLDQTFSCLGLFYFLVFTIIGYKGSIENYTEHGWPMMDFPLKNIGDP